jgi:hypothetical protein
MQRDITLNINDIEGNIRTEESEETRLNLGFELEYARLNLKNAIYLARDLYLIVDNAERTQSTYIEGDHQIREVNRIINSIDSYYINEEQNEIVAEVVVSQSGGSTMSTLTSIFCCICMQRNIHMPGEGSNLDGPSDI